MTPCLGFLDASHLPIFLVIGFAIFFGTIGAKVFQKFRIPQVVGYIAIGLLAGRSGLRLLDESMIQNLQPFSFFALGIIGFMIGGELHFDVLRKYGRGFFIILLAEGLGAFFVVGALVFGLAFALTGNAPLSAALGIVLGAISSATAPAATVDVLWEYKSRGILTTTIFAIVALDDGLALLLYGIAASVAGVMLGQSGGGLWAALLRTAYELGGAAALGTAAGFLLNFTLRAMRDREKALPFLIGSLAIVIGVARVMEVDLILSTMSLGMTLSNLAPRRSNTAFKTVESFAPPIYTLFFVIVGARLYVAGMATWMWALAAAYVVGRTAGKMAGAGLGARWAGVSSAVQKYLGLSLFSQAGVAVGLAILASDRFPGDMASAIIMIITATTFLVQIIGPPCVKLAIKKAGEIGLNVTEADLLGSYRVADMVERDAPIFESGTPLPTILRRIAQTHVMTYPVLDEDRRLLGLISINDLRRSFVADELARFLLAYDLMQPPPDSIREDAPLAEGVTRMREQGLECLPVLTVDGRFAGMLDLRMVNLNLSQELLRRRELADKSEVNPGLPAGHGEGT